MSEQLEIDEGYQNEGIEMGSLSHGIAQANMTTLLANDNRFRVITELSLDVSQIDLSQFGLKAKEELIPDVCLYSKKDKQRPTRGDDIPKMSKMPLLVIEVLSLKQTIDDIVTKFKAYFALDIKSCWLVIPANESVTVYSKPGDFVSFGTKEAEVVDETMDIHLPIQKIFEW
ncbi:Uma2 family endonuclease [Candidatus Parabeggiatoa sp. HSG14]|uniref:Uma2 family endonuclease n=1 Tax=Candidatus Parabeggiatoa sp. HSG14 TaxID=3055593 RepID=UPI0025A70BE1|nr:Uma2 family endonuclease [Thiotrichales bacterium HSG14]